MTHYLGTPERFSCQCGDERSPTWPTCQKCSGVLQYRRNSKTGEEFLGCSNFPKCRGTQRAVGEYPSCLKCGQHDAMSVQYFSPKRKSDWRPESEFDHLRCKDCWTYRLIVTAPWRCPFCGGFLEERNPWHEIEQWPYHMRKQVIEKILGPGIGSLWGAQNSGVPRLGELRYLFCPKSLQWSHLSNLYLTRSEWNNGKVELEKLWRISPDSRESCDAVRILVPGTVTEEVFSRYQQSQIERDWERVPEDHGYTDENQIHYMNSISEYTTEELEEEKEIAIERERELFGFTPRKAHGYEPTRDDYEAAQIESAIDRQLLSEKLRSHVFG